MSHDLHGWMVCDGQTLRLRTVPRRYGGQTLAEQRVGPEAVQAFDRLEPGELACRDRAIRAGSVEDGRWLLLGGRQVWP